MDGGGGVDGAMPGDKGSGSSKQAAERTRSAAAARRTLWMTSRDGLCDLHPHGLCHCDYDYYNDYFHCYYCYYHH